MALGKALARGGLESVVRMRRLLLVGVGSCSLAIAVFAGTDTIRITASNDSGSGEYVVHCVDCWDSDGMSFQWQSPPEPIPILSGQSGATVAWILSASVAANFDPYCEISIPNVTLVAGSTPTTFTVESFSVVFPETIPAAVAEGRATANVAVEDVSPNPPYALAVGLGAAGTGMASAFYNGAPPSASVFSHLVASVYAGQGAWAQGGQNDPPFGFRAIGNSVDDIGVRFAFTLTAGDLAEVSGNFRLPEPPLPCPGDMDGDRLVGFEDLTAMLSSFGLCEGDALFLAEADFDADGCVSLSDLSSFLAVFGEQCP